MRLFVHVALSVLRAATHATLFLEAQRLLLRLLRPCARNHLQQLESHILSRVQTPHTSRRVKTGECDEHLTILDFNPTSCHESTSRVAVLLHGHSMSSAYWYRNVDDLCSLGYRVLAVDLLGWGNSSRPLSLPQSSSEAIDWYVNSLQSALHSLNLPPVLLVGHSLGAYIALEFAKRYEKSVSKLVLVSPAGCTRSIPLSRAIYFSLSPQRIARRGGLLGYLMFMHAYPRTPAYTADRLRDYTYHLSSKHPAGGELAIRPLISFSLHSRNSSSPALTARFTRPLVDHLSPALNMPVQIVAGAHDTSMPVSGVYQLHKAMHSAGYDARMAVMDADHCPHIERPKLFFDIINTFIASSAS